MPTLLTDFAERNRLRVRRSEDGTREIIGKDGCIYEYGSGRLAVMVVDGTPKKWGFRRNAGLRAGMTLIQDGDAEGTLTFDPDDEAQAKAAIKIARIFPKRRVSEEERRRLAEMGRAHFRNRSKRALEGQDAA